MQRNPAKRIGSGKGDAEEIIKHSFFDGLDWESLKQKYFFGQKNPFIKIFVFILLKQNLPNQNF